MLLFPVAAYIIVKLIIVIYMKARQDVTKGKPGRMIRMQMWELPEARQVVDVSECWMWELPEARQVVDVRI